MATKQTYVEDSKKTTSTKDKNKQAIQNINRSGTVSGQKSGVSGLSNVTRTNTDASNLAGVNNIKNSVGTPKAKSGSTSATSSYSNALGNPSKRETGKTFVPDNYSTSKIATYEAKNALNKNKNNVNSVLSGMADESNRSIQSFFNKIGSAVGGAVNNAYQNNLDATEARRNAVYGRIAEARENKQTEADRNRQEKNTTTTQEQYNAMFNEDGSVRDFQSEINSRKNKVNELSNVIASSENGMDVSIAQDELKKVQGEIDYWEDLEDRYNALEEGYNLDQLKKSGDEEQYNAYREMYSHRKDNMAQRAFTASEHLLSSFANEVPALIDQSIYLANKASLDSAIADLDANRTNMSNDQYVETLATMNEQIQETLDNYNAGLSRTIQDAVDQYSANTYYGATDVEKFVLQAGESTAQFLLHFVVSKAVATAFTSTSALQEAGRNAIAENVADGFIGSADDMALAVQNELTNYQAMIESAGGNFNDELFRLGQNAVGGDIATHMMSLAGIQEKTNEMIQKGLPANQILLNAGASYLLSYSIEKTGTMDRFVEMLGTPASVDAFGRVLDVFKGGVSEGLEEVAESLVEPLINAVTLGEDYEVNGNEVLMSFLLGGASGLMMGAGANVASSFNSAPSIGKLLIQNRVQRNMVLNQIALLEKHLPTMTPHQAEVFREVSSNAMQAVNEYDSKSTTLGVSFSSDEVTDTTYRENEQNVYEAFTEDFNNEVQKTNELETIQAENEEKILGVVSEENSLYEATQKVLDENGYNVDAKVFNSLNEDQRKRTLVALDFAKLMGLNVNVVNNLPAGRSGYVDADGNIFIDGTKRSVLFTLTHELTHGTESSKYYPALKELVKNHYSNWNDVVADKQTEYREGLGQELSFEQAEQEVVARYVEQFLGDEKFIDDLIKYNYSLASKIWQNLKAIASNDETNKIRNTFEKAFADNYKQNGTRLSVNTDPETGTKYVVLDNQQLREDGTQKTKKEIFQSMLGKYVLDDGLEVEIVDKLPSVLNELGYKDMYDELLRRWPKFEEDLTKEERDFYNTKLNNNFVDELTTSTAKEGFAPDENEKHKAYGSVQFMTRTVPVVDENGARQFELTVIKLPDGRNIAYAKRFLSKAERSIADIIEKKDPIGHSTSESFYNNNISQGQENVNRNSYESDQYGYHYGAENLDLSKKSETLYSKSGSRNSGAYGTGTYFFGDGRFKSSYMDGSRTEHKVDFSDYKLFRPKNYNDGKKLHDIFLKLDNDYERFGNGTVSEYLDNIEKARDELYYTLVEERNVKELNEGDEAFNYVESLLKEAGIPENEVDNLFYGNPGETGYDLNGIIYDLERKYLDYREYLDYGMPWKAPKSLRATEELNNIFEDSELSKILGVNKERLNDIVSDSINEAIADKENDPYGDENNDSVPTRIMKALGYEGIDVRNIEGLDNEGIGSVIYDLKPESVRYSYDKDGTIYNKEEINDDFKQLQASSKAIVDRQGWEETSRYLDEDLQNRLSEVLRNELESRNYSDGNADGLLKDTGDFKILKDVDGQTFHDIFEIARAHLPYGELVDLHPVDTNEDWTGYNDTKNYLSSDGLSGFAITKDGDLISVFNLNRTKKGFLRAIAPFIRENAKTLDCYVLDKAISGTNLQQLYHDIFGFETKEVVDYDYKYDHDGIGQRYNDPQIAYMYNPNYKGETETNERDPDDLNISEKDLKKYKTVTSYNDHVHRNPNVDTATGVTKPTFITELESTIDRTTRKEELEDGEKWAGYVAQQLDAGVDPETILEEVKKNPLENSIIRANYVGQVLADRGMFNEMYELAQWARDTDRQAGQIIESTKHLHDLRSTFSRAVYMAKTEERMIDEYSKYKRKTNVEEIINDVFKKYGEDVINSKTVREFRAGLSHITREIRRLMPKTLFDRLKQFRLWAMLSGAKSPVGNMESNLATLALYKMNNINQAILESALKDVTIKNVDGNKTYKINQEERNATLRKNKATSKYNRNIAKQEWQTLKKEIKSKYDLGTEDIPEIIKNNLKIDRKNKAQKLFDMVADVAQGVQNALLNDAPFARVAFLSKFDELAQARGLDLKTIDKNSKTYDKLVEDAYKYAEEVVSHDETAISRTLANITRNSASNVKVDPDSYLKFLDEGIKWVKEKANKGEIGYKLIDNTLKKTQEWFAPFFKTNASLLKKSLQYSPLELVQVVNDYSKVRSGQMDLTEMVDHMAKFVTGSELYLLGMLFSRLGWLKWDKDDEDYSGRLSIKIPNTKYGYTTDFIDPVSTIFAKGVVLDQELQEEGVPFEKARKLWEDYETIFLSDELDMFSSLNDFVQTLKKVDKGEDQYGEYTLGDGATDTAFTVLNSYIPAIIRDISRLIDPNKKVVYDSRNWKYLANRLMNSTPFRGKLVDKKDATGNTLTYTQPFTGNETADRVLTMFSKGKLVDMQGKAVSGVKDTGNLGKEATQFTQMAQDFQFKDENGDGFSDAHWIRDSVPSNIYPAGEKTELNPEEKDKYGKTWTDTWTSGANYLLNNDEYKKLDYENQADIIYELQGFAREVIEADYCKEHDMEMTTAQQKASAIKDFVTKNGKVNGELLGLIALGNAKENKMANGGQRYVMAEQDKDGKTIKNSRQLMMRQIYEENGVYEDILKAIENSNGLLEYADFGLGKTVVGYSEDKAKKSYAEIYGEVMDKAKTKSTGKTGKASKGKTKKTTYRGKTGGRTSLKTSSLPKSNAKLGSLDTTKVANNYFKAYANVFNRSGKKSVSSGGTQSTCPNCGARVSANASRCPNCGAKL